MVKVLKKFNFKYHPRYFENPVLEHFNRKLEALVYNETAPDIEDMTLPNAAEHDAKIANLIPLIQEMFGQVSSSFPPYISYPKLHGIEMFYSVPRILEVNEAMMVKLVVIKQKAPRKICPKMISNKPYEMIA